MYKRAPDCAYYKESAMYWRSYVGVLLWLSMLYAVQMLVEFIAGGLWMPFAASDILANIVIFQLVLSLGFLEFWSWKTYQYVNRHGLLYELSSEPIGGRGLALYDIVLERKHSFLSWLWPRWGRALRRREDGSWEPTKWKAKQQGCTLWYRDWYWVSEGGHMFSVHGFDRLLCFVTYSSAEQFFDWVLPFGRMQYFHQEMYCSRFPDTDPVMVTLKHLLDLCTCIASFWRRAYHNKKQVLAEVETDRGRRIAELEDQRDFLGAMLMTIASWSLFRIVNGRSNSAKDSNYLQAIGWFTEKFVKDYCVAHGISLTTVRGFFEGFLHKAKELAAFEGLIICRAVSEPGRPPTLLNAVKEVFGDKLEYVTPKPLAPTNDQTLNAATHC